MPVAVKGPLQRTSHHFFNLFVKSVDLEEEHDHWYAGGEVLCAISDLPPCPLKLCRLQKVIGKAVRLVAERVMKKVAAEAIEENCADNKTSATSDSSW